MMAQSNREVAFIVNQNTSAMAFQLRDFTRMNPPVFIFYKVDEDPQDFLDEDNYTLYSMVN